MFLRCSSLQFPLLLCQHVLMTKRMSPKSRNKIGMMTTTTMMTMRMMMNQQEGGENVSGATEVEYVLLAMGMDGLPTIGHAYIVILKMASANVAMVAVKCSIKD